MPCRCSMHESAARAADSLMGWATQEQEGLDPLTLPMKDPMMKTEVVITRLFAAVRNLQQRVTQLECERDGHPDV